MAKYSAKKYNIVIYYKQKKWIHFIGRIWQLMKKTTLPNYSCNAPGGYCMMTKIVEHQNSPYNVSDVLDDKRSKTLQTLDFVCWKNN